MPADRLQLDAPLFHRVSTKQTIESLANHDRIAIYLGAGATIDRTGMSWAQLIGELMQVEFADARHRTSLIEHASPLAAASVASEIYRSRFGADWRERLNDAIRSRLYQQPESPAGKIVERAVELAYSVVRRGGSAVIVTPNYDDFIIQELERKDDSDVGPVFFYLGAFGAPLTPDEVEENSSIVRDEVEVPGSISVVHLHGILRSHPDELAEGGGQPVLSEEDYWSTAEQSRRILEGLFKDRTVLIAGAGMSDPPLLNALLATRKSGKEAARHPRYAILRIPVAGQNPVQYRDSLAFESRRLDHFGVNVIPVDHFGQISQVFTEVEVASRHPHTAYSSPTNSMRYGARLTKWWRDWLYQGAELQQRQTANHKYLVKRMSTIRGVLGAATSEPLKLEVWARWDPESSARKLRLWSSSIGVWKDDRSVRDGDIAGETPLVAVQTFCTGSSIRKPVESDRWKTYLATPVWLPGEHDAPMQVGVVVLSSMWSESDSSLGPKNATRASAALLEMHRVGALVLTPAGKKSAAAPVPVQTDA